MDHVPSIADLLGLAHQASDAISNNFRFQQAQEYEWKVDGTPITPIDRGVNTLVLEWFAKKYPHISVLGEEGDRHIEDAEYTALCDPVDGTIPFTLGLPIFSFCITLLQRGAPVKTVVADPILNRCWHAERKHGCRLDTNASKQYVSGHGALDRSKLCIHWWQGARFHLEAVHEHLLKEGVKTIMPMSVALMGGLIASGKLEASIFPSPHRHETAAMQLLVEEAGGKATDIFGEPLNYDPKADFRGHIISNGHIHDELVRLVREANYF